MFVFNFLDFRDQLEFPAWHERFYLQWESFKNGTGEIVIGLDHWYA